MQKIHVALALGACMGVLSLSSLAAHAGSSKVDCSSPGAKGKIGNVLKRLDPAATNVVHVGGHCNENVVIRGFDRLFLIAMPGAAIEGVAGEDLPVIEIADSRRVVVQGFTIRGGNSGLVCKEFSSCRFVGDTVEDTKSGAANFNAAITVDGSEVELTDVVVRNVVDLGIALYGAKAVAKNVSIDGVRNVNGFTGGAGVFMTAASLRNGPITIQNAAAAGLSAFHGSALDISQLTVTDNGGIGVWVGNGTAFNVGQVTATRNKVFGLLFQDGSTGNFYGTGSLIDSNQYTGMVLEGGSSVGISGVTVSNNPVGLWIGDLSYASFFGPSSFAQSAFLDISCESQVAAVKGLENAAYSTTNCVPPPFPAASVPGRSLNLPRLR